MGKKKNLKAKGTKTKGTNKLNTRLLLLIAGVVIIAFGICIYALSAQSPGSPPSMNPLQSASQAMSAQATALENQAAGEIVIAEAERVAHQIDTIVGFKGVSNIGTIQLSKELKVGNDDIAYAFEITNSGDVIVTLEVPYQGIKGETQFGLQMNQISDTERIDCSSNQIQNGASLTVKKESRNEYVPDEGVIYRITKVTIDAASSCGEYIVLEERFREG